MVATINHERMPVLLTREDEFETWLKGTPGEALALAREYPPEQMRICGRASTRKTTFERRNRTAARCSVPLNGAGVRPKMRRTVALAGSSRRSSSASR